MALEDVHAYLSKSDESLAGAESEFAAGRFGNCANRCYFACFQAAIAALVAADVLPPRGEWSHSFVQSQFVGLLISRRKRYHSELSGTLQHCMHLRHVADYSNRSVPSNQARRALRRTNQFVAAVLQREGSPR